MAPVPKLEIMAPAEGCALPSGRRVAFVAGLLSSDNQPVAPLTISLRWLASPARIVAAGWISREPARMAAQRAMVALPEVADGQEKPLTVEVTCPDLGLTARWRGRVVGKSASAAPGVIDLPWGGDAPLRLRSGRRYRLRMKRDMELSAQLFDGGHGALKLAGRDFMLTAEDGRQLPGRILAAQSLQRAGPRRAYQLQFELEGGQTAAPATEAGTETADDAPATADPPAPEPESEGETPVETPSHGHLSPEYFEPAVETLQIESPVVGGSTVDASVQLTRPARQGGASIVVSCEGDQQLVQALGPIVVPEGEDTAAFSLLVDAAAVGQIKLKAENPQRPTPWGSFPLRVEPGPSLLLTPPPVFGISVGDTAGDLPIIVDIRLQWPAPAGCVVSLSDWNPWFLDPPATVAVPEGQDYVSFEVQLADYLFVMLMLPNSEPWEPREPWLRAVTQGRNDEPFGYDPYGFPSLPDRIEYSVAV